MKMKTKVKINSEIKYLRDSYYLAYKINCGNKLSKFYLKMFFVFFIIFLILAIISEIFTFSILFYFSIFSILSSIGCLWRNSEIQKVLKKDMRKYIKIMEKLK